MGHPVHIYINTLYTHWKGLNVSMFCIYIIYLVYTLEGFKCINVLYIYIYTLYTHWKGLNVSMFCIYIYLVYTLEGFKCINVLYRCRISHPLYRLPCSHHPDIFHGYYCIQEQIKPFFMMRSSKPNKLYFWFMFETLVLNWENYFI